jgi:hypothetical protein
MNRLPAETVVEFDPPVAFTVGFPGSSEIQYIGVTSALKDESGSLHLIKSNGNLIEISHTYLYFEIHKEIDDE